MKIVELNENEMKSLDEISKDGVKRFVYPDFGVTSVSLISRNH